MTALRAANWFELAERRFEYRVIAPFGIVWLVMAVVQVAVHGNWRLGLALLVASFFAGIIGSSLHKNQNKTHRDLAQGPSHDSAIRAPELSENDQAHSFARTTMRFATLVAALIAFIAFDAGYSWLGTIAAVAVAWFAATALAAVGSLAEIMLWSWRTKSQ